MSCILHIETSTEVCSVALSQDGINIFAEEDSQGRKEQYATECGSFQKQCDGIDCDLCPQEPK